MMNVLDALRMRLGVSGGMDTEGEKIDPALLEAMGLRGRGPQQLLPSWLPLGVQDQIRNNPSYGEGVVIPGSRNPLMEQEAAAGVFAGPQREERLQKGLGVARDTPNWPPINEGEYAFPLPRQSPFASPLNQLLQLGRRAPLSMY